MKMRLPLPLPALPRESWSVVVTTGALVLYGVLQERVMTRGWGPQLELFPYSSFLVLSNRLLTVLVLLLHSLAAGHSFVPVAPLRSYCLVSASNMVSTLCQYEALKYVSFVAQTLAKTAKALPVVLWGTLVGGKRYSARQYGHALLITGGCSAFVLGGDVTAGSARPDVGWRGALLGGGLLLAYLGADGWTSTQQEALFKTHATPIREQLLYTTAFSSVYSLAATLAAGQLTPALAFLGRHPDAAAAVASLSLASTVIQVCISTVLQRHGALAFALIMTTRQCVSVLLSTLLFGHALTLSQWVGITLAFSALYHQKSAGRHDRAAARSRHGGAAAGRLPQARESAAGAASCAGAPLLSPGAQAASKPAAVTQTSVAFRGASTGGSCAGAAAAAAAGSMVGAGCAAPSGVCPTPSTIPAAAAVGAVAALGPAADPHCVAVADVLPGGGGLLSPGGPRTSHVLNRGHGHGSKQHHQHQQGGGAAAAAGLPLLPHAAAPAALQPVCSHHGGPHHHHNPLSPSSSLVGAAGLRKPTSLLTLWSYGAGRALVDPTTAVAIEHREK